MRTSANSVRDFEPVENRPARGIQAIAANFFAWEFFAFQNDHFQTGLRAKSRACRSGRSAAHDCDIKNIHRDNGKRSTFNVQRSMTRQLIEHSALSVES